MTGRLDGNAAIYPASVIVPILEALEEKGITKARALVGTDLQPEDIARARKVSADVIFRVYANAAALVDDPRFAFQAGLRYHLTSYGMYGFAALSSTSFREALQHVLDYSRGAHTPLELKMILSEDQKTVTFVMDPLLDLHREPRLYQFVVDVRIGQMLTICRDIVGHEFTPSEIAVAYDRNVGGSSIELPGCSVIYGATENRFVFDSAWLQASIERGNAGTHAMLVDLCNEMLTEFDRSFGHSGKVRTVLSRAMGQRIDFATLSRELGYSARTLRRKLDEEGTSYSAIVDDIRIKIARKYLGGTNIKIGAISDILGFSDEASFRRFLARQTGCTPRQIREEGL